VTRRFVEGDEIGKEPAVVRRLLLILSIRHPAHRRQGFSIYIRTEGGAFYCFGRGRDSWCSTRRWLWRAQTF